MGTVGEDHNLILTSWWNGSGLIVKKEILEVIHLLDKSEGNLFRMLEEIDQRERLVDLKF